MAQAETQIAPKLVVRKLIRAKREKVFEYWTKPELLKQWLVPPQWTTRTTTDLRVGGKFEHTMIVSDSPSACTMGFTPGESLWHGGEYLEVKPPEKIVFSWDSHLVEGTRVTVEFKELGDSTEIWLTHELLPNDNRYKAHSDGWTQFIDQLEQLLTTNS